MILLLLLYSLAVFKSVFCSSDGNSACKYSSCETQLSAYGICFRTMWCDVRGKVKASPSAIEVSTNNSKRRTRQGMFAGLVVSRTKFNLTLIEFFVP